MTRASHFVVSGRVQGVGFRAHVAEAARAEGLDGWVRNLPDGNVDVQAEGEAEALSRFESRLWQGPPMSRVDAVACQDAVLAGTRGFRIA